MVVDAGGDVHIAALLGDDLYYVTNKSGTWTRRLLGSAPARRSYRRPAIAIDPADGSLWVVFSSESKTCCPSFDAGVLIATNASGTWSSPVKLTETGGSPHLAIVDGVAHVAYTETFGLEDAGSFYLRYDGQSEVTATVMAGDSSALAIRATADGVVEVLYETGGSEGESSGERQSHAHLGRYQPSSGTFDSTDLPGAVMRYDSGGFGATGEPFLNWYAREGNEDRFKYLFDGGWSEPHAGTAFAVDERGVAHALQYNPDDARIWYLAHQGGSWTDHELTPATGWWGVVALGPDGRPHIFLSGDAGSWYAVGPLA